MHATTDLWRCLQGCLTNLFQRLAKTGQPCSVKRPKKILCITVKTQMATAPATTPSRNVPASPPGRVPAVSPNMQNFMDQARGVVQQQEGCLSSNASFYSTLLRDNTLIAFGQCQTGGVAGGAAGAGSGGVESTFVYSCSTAGGSGVGISGGVVDCTKWRPSTS